MKRASLTLAILLACNGGADPSQADAGDVSGVLVASCTNCSAEIAGVGIDGHKAYAGVVSTSTNISVVTFDPPAAANIIWTGTNGAASTLGVAASGGQLAWLDCSQAPNCIFRTAPETAIDAGTQTPWATSIGSQTIGGLEYDGTTIFAALGSPNGGTNGQSNLPDNNQWPGGSFNALAGPGTIHRAQGGTVTQIVSDANFALGYTNFVLAHDASHVFWLDVPGGSVGSVKYVSFDGSGETTLADIPKVNGGAMGPVGIAASGSHIAWAASAEPGIKVSPGCWIWASDALGAPQQIVNDTTFDCHGLATDGQYVYFAIISYANEDCNNCSGTNVVAIGTGIGRAPISGGAIERVNLASTRYYGPRRVLVDDAFIYAIDPAIIVRVPKTEFH